VGGSSLDAVLLSEALLSSRMAAVPSASAASWGLPVVALDHPFGDPGGSVSSPVLGEDLLAGGTGTHTWNVGTNGTAIGLQNNTSYTVFQLLQQATLTKKNGTFDADAFNTIFGDINQKGDL
jgi:hypothetical protein